MFPKQHYPHIKIFSPNSIYLDPLHQPTTPHPPRLTPLLPNTSIIKDEKYVFVLNTIVQILDPYF